MSWLKIDDNFTQHPKIVQLSVKDRWTWMELLCYCARYRTKGVVLGNIGGVIRGATPAFLSRCGDLGLLDEDDGRFSVHDWAIYNGGTVAEKVAAFLEANPSSTANDVCKAVGGKRELVLAEVTKIRYPSSQLIPGNQLGGSKSGSRGRAAPPRPSSSKTLPSAGTPRTTFVCPHDVCRVSKKTERALLEHLADVHGDDEALARVHALEAEAA